jgi:hypothetical protein
MKINSFLKSTYSWLILAPILLVLLGAASNQAVLIANHGKFPVMLNERQQEMFSSENDVEETRDNAERAIDAYRDAQDLADKDRVNQVLQIDAFDARKAARAAYQDNVDAVKYKQRGDFDKVHAAAVKSKADMEAAEAADDKAVKDSKVPVSTNKQEVSDAPAKKTDTKKDFTILNTSVGKDDIQGQFLDSVHSVMGPNSHLKAMADIFDLGSIYSIGDFGIILGMYFFPFLALLFIGLNLRKIESLKNVAYVVIGLSALLFAFELLSFSVLAFFGIAALVSGLVYALHHLGKGFSEIKLDV